MQLTEGRTAELGDRASAADLDGFARRFDRHRVRLERECSSLLGDPDLAKDIVQETFLRAREALDRFDGSRPLLPWLLVIARRLCIDHLRRASRARFIAMDAVVSDPPSPAGELAGDATYKAVRRGELRRALRRAFGRLPERHQRMLRLAVVEGHSYAEIAEACDTSEKAVKSALCRARERLRLEFRRVGEDGVLGVAGWSIARPLTSWWRRMRSYVHALPGSTVAALEGQVGALLVAAVVVATGMVGSDQDALPTSSLSSDDAAADVVSIDRDGSGVPPAMGLPSPSSETPEAVDTAFLEAGEKAGSPDGEVAVAVEASIQGGERPSVQVRDEERADDENGEGEARLRLYCDRGSSLRKGACEVANGALDRARAE